LLKAQVQYPFVLHHIDVVIVLVLGMPLQFMRH